MDPKPPAFEAPSFNCPHPACGALAQHTWNELYIETPNSAFGAEDFRRADLWQSTCLACERRTIWRKKVVMPDIGGPRGGLNPNAERTPRVEHVMVYPVATLSGPSPNDDMPQAVADLYLEASQVAALSPRSASALLRLALEALLRTKYGGGLNEMIGAAVKDGLPSEVQRAMDYVRFRGNGSAHDLQSDDTPETVAVLFTLVNLVTERLISQPKELSALYETLPEGMRKQIDERDGQL